MKHVDLLCLLTMCFVCVCKFVCFLWYANGCILLCFVCVVNLFCSWCANGCTLSVIKHWVLSFAEEEEAELGTWVMQYYCWSWFSVEFCTNGMVSLMFDFFCRSDYPIDISRWVKLFVKLTYDLLSCVCGILVVCFHYVFFVWFFCMTTSNLLPFY